MPTKTATPNLTLAEAEEAREALLEKIAHGTHDIDPLELSQAEAAVTMARLTDDAVARRRAQEAESLRLGAIDEQRRAAHAMEVSHIPDLFDTAVAAVQALMAAGEDIERASTKIARRLSQLRPYPMDVDVGARIGDRPDPNGRPRSLDGVRLYAQGYNGRLSNNLAAAVLAATSPGSFNSSAAAARSTTQSILRRATPSTDDAGEAA